MEKKIVVLAKSVKNRMHCVAGKCLESKNWVRPVSNDAGGALSDDQVCIKNPYGVYPLKILQNIRIIFDKHAPLINQPENFVISEHTWMQEFTTSRSELQSMIDSPNSLWGPGDNIPYRKILNNEVVIEQSLYLIEVDKITLVENDGFERKTRNAFFSYNGIDYHLKVTDPNFKLLDKNIDLGRKYLCISLGEPFEVNGNCYKLVASII